MKKLRRTIPFWRIVDFRALRLRVGSRSHGVCPRDTGAVWVEKRWVPPARGTAGPGGVVDEAHRLKNDKSLLAINLRKCRPAGVPAPRQAAPFVACPGTQIGIRGTTSPLFASV